MLPTISVIIPALNAAAWLPLTLNNLRAVEYPPGLLDVCVVDDGSTDGTEVVARALLRHAHFSGKIVKSNRIGPAGARNLGLKHTRGSWIQFLDSDDLLARQKLLVQGRTASQSSPEVAVVFSRWTTLERHDGVWMPSLPGRFPRIGVAPVLELIQSENFLATGCQLFNRDWLFRLQGFDENYLMVEDVHLALRLAIAGGRFVEAPSDTSLFFYRRRAGSLSTVDRVAFWDGCVKNGLLAEAYWRQSQEDLHPEQTQSLLHIYGNALRAFYPQHRERFFSLFAHVKKLKPDYTPVSPRPLKWLARAVGYCQAEAIALAYRRVKWQAGFQRHLCP